MTRLARKTVQGFPVVGAKKKTAKKSQEKFANFVGEATKKKSNFQKKKGQEIILASQFFFLAPQDFHGNFSLISFLLVKLMNQKSRC